MPTAPDAKAPPLAPADRFPAGRVRGRFGRATVLAACLAAAVFSGLELFWRGHGLTPSVQDTPTLWAVQRARAGGARFGPPFGGGPGGGPVVLLGASRMHLGFDVPLCRRRLPGRPVCQLAVPGTSPWAVFHDLAADRLFPPAGGGTVLVALSVNHVSNYGMRQAAPYVDRGRRGVTARDEFEARLAAAARGGFAAAGPDAAPKAVAARLKQGRPLVPRLRRAMRADRSAWLTQTGPAPAVLKKQMQLVRMVEAYPAVPGGFAAVSAVLAADVAALRARGARVAVVGFPSTGRLAEAENARYPRADYWDPLVETLAADAAVHHADLPSAGTFDCPDWSHLSAPSAAVFTDELLDELERRGVF